MKFGILVFPGSNCDRDVATVTSGLLKQPTRLIWHTDTDISDCDVIVLPGGFSYGDYLRCGAIARFAPVMRSLQEHVAKGKYVIGICNGFQALIKLGLVPYGEITGIDKDSSTLTYNKIGRHMSCLIKTRIASVKSPWMAGVQVGDIHTLPISHGEGRFIGSDKLIRRLAERGQIATQYVDFEGKPSMDINFNPNYSAYAIEGITSEDGRVFGKMAHSERIGQNLYKNVPGNFDQKIFESGVNYFK